MIDYENRVIVGGVLNSEEWKVGTEGSCGIYWEDVGQE